MKLKNKENYVKVPIDSLRLSKNVRKEFDQGGLKCSPSQSAAMD